jgi:hypothetical protein
MYYYKNPILIELSVSQNDVFCDVFFQLFDEILFYQHKEDKIILVNLSNCFKKDTMTLFLSILRK